jgi:hypothetical protein
MERCSPAGVTCDEGHAGKTRRIAWSPLGARVGSRSSARLLTSWASGRAARSSSMAAASWRFPEKGKEGRKSREREKRR